MRLRTIIILSLIFFSAISTACVSEETAEIKEKYENALKKFNEFRKVDLNPGLEVVDTEWVVKRWGSYEHKEELFYKAMLLLPANYSFEKAKEHDLSSFVAFTWEGKIYVVKDNYNPQTFERTIYHELEHLFQERFDIKSDGTFDGEKAKASAIEGDAKLISRMLAGDEYRKEKLSELNEDNAYYLLGYAPYLFGYNLAIEVLNRTNDTTLLLENPPKTMEQVIHPEKYFKVEDFEQIHISEKQNRLGELFILFFLGAHVYDSVAFIASEGWNGDAYLLNDTGWVWKISFDSEKDAQEFEFAVKGMLTKIGENEDGFFVVKDKYLPQKIKIEKHGRYVTLISEFLEV